MKEYLRMVLLARRQFGLLVLGIFCMALSAVFDGIQLGIIVPAADKIFNQKPIVVPEGMPEFVDRAVAWVNDFPSNVLFYWLIAFLPALFLIKSIFLFLQGLLMNTVGQKAMMDVRNRLFAKYQELSMDFYTKKRQGELVSRVVNDVGTIGNAISYGLTDTVYQTFQVIVYTTIALFISPMLVIVLGVMLPVISAVVLRIGRQLKYFSRLTQETAADMTSLLNESIQGVHVIRGFSREPQEVKRFDKVNSSWCKYTLKGIRRNILLQPVTEFISVLGIVALLYFGGREVLAGRMSFGVFILFVVSLVSVVRPVKKLSNVHGINQQALASSERVYEILDRSVSVADAGNAVEIPAPRTAIEFRNVSFSYDLDDGWVLRDVSHSFEIGKVTAIVGPTGCGKSTTLNLIPRFYDPQKGMIAVDDTDIRTVRQSSLREKIGIVTQETILFHDTIRENLRYGKIDATDEEIFDACRQALAYEFIRKMPQGLDTVVGDRGVRLSGGQKQRLCIARAILRNPQILLLDEATSALDAESEHYVQQALNNVMEGRTVIVVAHRLSTVKHASCILVMNEGRIVQKGTHDELLETSPLYKKLADLHFSL